MGKTWNSIERRPLVVLVGLYAEEWEECISYKHIHDLPGDGPSHPLRIIQGIYGLSLTIKHDEMPWVLITNRLEAIYALNNLIMASRLDDAEVSEIMNPELRLDPKNIVAYLCDSETEEPVCISDPNTGWIDEEPLGKYGEQLHEDLTRIGIKLELQNNPAFLD